MTRLDLNRRAAALCDEIAQSLTTLEVTQTQSPCGTTLLDFGIEAPGSPEAALLLARVTLADLGSVQLLASTPWPRVEVHTDWPVAACMASQYAGWEVRHEDYFAMGSGPMRAAATREPLFERIDYHESPDVCVGVLESNRLPPEAVCRQLAEQCQIDPHQLTLLVAPTHSRAGTLQVVARSVETALHKLDTLGFDLERVVRGTGSAPLCPLVTDDATALGHTNDAILYGSSVRLEVTGEDASLESIGPQLPSASSEAYGQPFAEILARHNHDFYQIDPLLFSAAQIELYNIDTGHRFQYGQLNPALLAASWGQP